MRVFIAGSSKISTKEAEPTPDVLIVGGGPTGLSLAILLADAGVRAEVVERDPLPQQHPAACILNTRTMEIFRKIGIEDTVRTSCQDVLTTGHISWVTSLAGQDLGRRSAAPHDLDAALAASPTHTVHFPQHRLEPMLWEAVEQNPNVQFSPGHVCETFRQDADGVVAAVVDTAEGSQREIRAKYLIGCDGAASGVRRTLGVQTHGPVLQYMLGLHFMADLSRFVEHRQSVLYWLLNRDVVGVLIGHWMPSEWVLNVPYFPPQQQPEQFTPEVALDIIYTAIGTRDVPGLELKNVGPWVMAARMAETFQVGRVLLAGDAAHSMPPTGGLGLNTGVQDAHNLAWKLAAVLKGSASPELLATYELERRPVARRNIDQSVINFDKFNELNKLVGVNFQLRNLLERVQNAKVFRMLPESWQSGLVRQALRFGLRKFGVLEAETPRGQRIRAEYSARLPERNEHYRLGMDLGFAYNQGVVVPESTPMPAADDPVEDYLPTTWPGCRLPHFWVEHNGRRVSVHDLLDLRGYRLLVHVEGQARWRDAINALNGDCRMPVEVVSVGPQPEADAVDQENAWRHLSEVEESGAVLVRPDGHVAWRSRALPESPEVELRAVLSRLMI